MIIIQNNVIPPSFQSETYFDGCSITIPSFTSSGNIHSFTHTGMGNSSRGAFPILDVDGEAKHFMSFRIPSCRIEEEISEEEEILNRDEENEEEAEEEQTPKEESIIFVRCSNQGDNLFFLQSITTDSFLFICCRWMKIRLSVVDILQSPTQGDEISIKLKVYNWDYIVDDIKGFIQSDDLILDIVNPGITANSNHPIEEGRYIRVGNEIRYKSTIPPQTIKLANQGTLLQIKNCNNLTFSGIHFRNNGISDVTSYSFLQADYCSIGCVEIDGSNNITFDNCEFSSIMGYCAIVGKESSCTNIKFINCRVHDTFGGGFLFKNCEAGEVQNCLIKHYGLIMSGSVGIILGSDAHGCLITKNTIHDGCYTGISVGWTWGYNDNCCKNNIISYNHIHHCMKQIHDDGGGIYTLGMSEGTIIEKNVIHDIISRCGISAPAIYLDEGSSFIKCRNNVCYGCDMGVQLHYGYANEICNNIFAYCSSHVFRFGVPENLTPLDENLGFYAHNNLIYIDSGVLMEALREKCAYLFSHNLLDIEMSGQLLSTKYDWIRFRKFIVGSLGMVFGSSAPLRLTMFGLETTQNPLPSNSINFFPIFSDSKGFHRIDILDTPGLYGISASMKSLYDSDQSNYANFEQQRLSVTTNIQHYSSTYFNN